MRGVERDVDFVIGVAGCVPSDFEWFVLAGRKDSASGGKRVKLGGRAG